MACLSSQLNTPVRYIYSVAAPAWYFRLYSYDLHINRDQEEEVARSIRHVA